MHSPITQQSSSKVQQSSRGTPGHRSNSSMLERTQFPGQYAEKFSSTYMKIGAFGGHNWYQCEHPLSSVGQSQKDKGTDISYVLKQLIIANDVSQVDGFPALLYRGGWVDMSLLEDPPASPQTLPTSFGQARISPPLRTCPTFTHTGLVGRPFRRGNGP